MTTRNPLTREQKDARNAQARARRAANKNSSLSPEFAAKMNAAGEGALEVIARPHNKNMRRTPVVETPSVVEPTVDKAELSTGENENNRDPKEEAQVESLLTAPAAPVKTFKYARPSMPELIAAVRAYATAHRAHGGWDYVEAWSTDDLITVIDKATSIGGAIINTRNAVKVARKEVQSA